jgi:asparagine synthase (glutamine-hydrolysing)
MTRSLERPPRTDAASSIARGIARRLDRLVGRAAEARLSALASSVRREKLTFLSPVKLRVIESSLSAVRRGNVPGDFLELGVALGGSAIIIAAQIGKTRRFHGYDVFGMAAPSNADDVPADCDDSLRCDDGTDLYDCVTESFGRFGLNVDGDRITLYRDRFEDAFDADDGRSLAFVHINCDWYEPVRFCLSAVCPRLSPGALIVLDDYNDWGGCKRAVDDLLDSDPGCQLVRRGPNAVLRRI